jgi:hypothetical protein
MMPAVATASHGAKRGVARKAPKPEARASQAVAALQLLGRWQRVCSGHLSFTNGCACGVGASVDLGDLDDLIIDYLKRKFEPAPLVAGFIAGHDVPGGMKSLLRALATGAEILSPDAARDLIAAIEASVASIEEQHRT